MLENLIHYGRQRFEVCRDQFEKAKDLPPEQKEILSRRLSVAYDFLVRAEELKRVEEHFLQIK